MSNTKPDPRFNDLARAIEHQVIREYAHGVHNLLILRDGDEKELWVREFDADSYTGENFVDIEVRPGGPRSCESERQHRLLHNGSGPDAIMYRVSVKAVRIHSAEVQKRQEIYRAHTSGAKYTRVHGVVTKKHERRGVVDVRLDDDRDVELHITAIVGGVGRKSLNVGDAVRVSMLNDKEAVSGRLLQQR